MANHHEVPIPIKTNFFTTGTKIITLIAVAGIATFLYRFIGGLGAVTNLDDQYPWGIWIAIDVASGVALAAGGFTTAALADIFHREKYHIITRPALLTALLGYTFVAIGVLTDLGHVFDGLPELLMTLDGVFLESNYDVSMLENGPYPAFLKNRIKGRSGHISNAEAAGLLSPAFRDRLKWACLAHLSEQNNTPRTALDTHRNIIGSGAELSVASRYGVSSVFSL